MTDPNPPDYNFHTEWNVSYTVRFIDKHGTGFHPVVYDSVALLPRVGECVDFEGTEGATNVRFVGRVEAVRHHVHRLNKVGATNLDEAEVVVSVLVDTNSTDICDMFTENPKPKPSK